MSKIPNCEERLSAMSVCLIANEATQNVFTSSEVMLKAVNEIKDSARLKYIFKAVLGLTNALTTKDNAQQSHANGFKLSSLIKLSQVKTNSGETMEKYIVSRIFSHVPEALELRGDMPGLDNARKVLFPRLKSDLQRLEKGLELMKKLSRSPEIEDTPGIVVKMGKLIDDNTRLFDRASASLLEAEAEFKDLCIYLGEEGPVPGSDPEKIFSQLARFVVSVETIVEALALKEKRKLKQQQQNVMSSKSSSH